MKYIYTLKQNDGEFLGVFFSKAQAIHAIKKKLNMARNKKKEWVEFKNPNNKKFNKQLVVRYTTANVASCRYEAYYLERFTAEEMMELLNELDQSERC